MYIMYTTYDYKTKSLISFSYWNKQMVCLPLQYELNFPTFAIVINFH